MTRSEALIRAQKKYSQSKKGKSVIKNAQKKYLKTEKGKKSVNKKMSNLYYSNSKHRIGLLMRNRINQILKNKKFVKKNRFLVYLGCTPSELKFYIEKKFQPGMTWDNWKIGGWHIDHIVPLSSAKNEEEIMKLCHYSNLQPLWAIDNLKKADKLK